MEAILARALEYTLKYWLKSFSRDQLKLQGRTVQLSNLDINGEALHASMGLPPALSVTKAKVGKFEIILPYVSNVQVEPIVIQIDKLDLVLEENRDFDASSSPSSTQTSASSKGGGYGFADKIADGMTIHVTTVNLLLEMRGGARREGGAAWAPPLASLTIHNLSLYTTNESWQIVNLKEARDYSNNKKFIYVFKKLEWESLSIDLLPHPDMFADANIARFQEGGSQRDDDGAKRVFFGGERFLEGIAGEAYITMQRTEQNSALGLEVQVHVTEAVCPALSEPGLRALLRFLTGLYVCLSRGDVDLKSQQQCTEAAGLSLVSILVDHIFLCIKDAAVLCNIVKFIIQHADRLELPAEFRLELLMQSLLFSRATVSDGETTKNLTSVKIGGILLRDTFCRPPCALVQPTMRPLADDAVQIPDFANNFCPPIYPLEDQQWQLSAGIPLMCLHSLQIKPSPMPPTFASETVISCQPIMFHLQEESCLRIASFLADGIMALNPGDVLPDYSVNSIKSIMKELDVVIPLDVANFIDSSEVINYPAQFSGARLHIESLVFSESPLLSVKQLSLEKDPACFLLWHGQPIDASQKKWTIGASHLVLSLETSSSILNRMPSPKELDTGVLRCLEFQDASIEVAMVSADGSALTVVPPPGGVVRIGVACQQFSSNTSVEQLFFVLDLYAYFGRVGDKIASVSKSRGVKANETSASWLIERAPCDTAVSLELKALQLRFLESSGVDTEALPLVQFGGEDLLVKVCHRTLGGAIAVSSTLRWESVEVSCVDTVGGLKNANDALLNPVENGHKLTANGCPHLRAVFWVHNVWKDSSNGSAQAIPFLDISLEHMIPLSEVDRECHNLGVSACVSGVRLGGGMNYAEALLHRFGVFGPDGSPGVGLSKGIENLSKGPIAKLFKTSPLNINDLGEDGSSRDGDEGGFLLGVPDEVDIRIELKDWLFALEGAPEPAEQWWFNDSNDAGREEKCWHTNFQSLLVKATSGPKKEFNENRKLLEAGKYPVESVTVAVEGLQILKPRIQKAISSPVNGIREVTTTSGGINLEACMALMEIDDDNDTARWIMENVKFSVKQPIEAVVTKDELQHLTFLCKSEIDAMGRITAGILKLLKLEQSIGRSTLDQLSNLGTESFDKIFTPDKPSRVSSPRNAGLSRSSDMINGSPLAPMESTITSLEESILDTQARCISLISAFRGSGPSLQHSAGDIRILAEKLENMKVLLGQLQNHI